MKNIRLALRSIFHFKLYTIVNILGLALSLACVIVIFRYVYGEITVDRFNTKLDRMYIPVIEDRENPGTCFFYDINSDSRDTEDFQDFKQDPAFEATTRFIAYGRQKTRVNNDEYLADILIAIDDDFLKLFDYPLLSGTLDLSRPNVAAVTKEYAAKVFGNTDPLGQTIQREGERSYTITAVIGKTPTRSSMEFDVLMSKNGKTPEFSTVGHTVVLLRPDQDYRKLNEKYSDFRKVAYDYYKRCQLLPYKDIYLNSSHVKGPWWTGQKTFIRGNRSNVILLFSVGILILFIGVINFINIYLAVVMRRGRELGMKKVFGANGGSIFLQLFIENFALVGIAAVFALSIVELTSPLVKKLLGLDQIPFVAFDFVLAGIILFLLPFVTTIFPYMRYRYSIPITSLRSVGKMGGRGISRYIFLVLQYGITIFIIIMSMFFNKQLYGMLNTDPGFRTSDVIHVPGLFDFPYYEVLSNEEFEEKQGKEEAIAQEMEQRIKSSPVFVKHIFGASPIQGRPMNYNFKVSGGQDDYKELNMMDTFSEWLDFFEIKLIDGRLFENDKDLHWYRGNSVIVTESVLDYYNITDWRNTRLEPDKNIILGEDIKIYNIIGVVGDVFGAHLSHKKNPTIFFNLTSAGRSRNNDFYGVVAPGKRQEAIEFLRKLKQESIGGEFEYDFLEDEVAAMYAEDKKVASVYTVFSAIAIVISMLGLFSMSLFDVQQRYNEIAIRKVNGATTADVIGLLLKKYIVLLLVAFVIASPAAWLMITRYLENFAFKTPLSWWIFALALLVTAGVSLLTLIFQTRKAADTNPAVVIRHE